MKYQLNIKQVYLDSIIKGDKIHEYRLANEKRRQVQVGDTLELVSETSSLEVEVTNIQIASNWYEALKDNYQKDFGSIKSVGES